MQSQYILPLILGIGVGLLVICVILLLHKLFMNREKDERTKKENRRKKSTAAMTPTIIPQNIPGFMLPTWRNVRVQEPLRRPASGLIDDVSSDEFDVDSMKPRNNNQVPVSTVMKASQRCLDDMRKAKIEIDRSPLISRALCGMSGSISLQDLNVYAQKSRSRQGSPKGPQPSLKFALYYSAASGELNVTVVSVTNLNSNQESTNLCVWVQVEFTKYHQEFRTKKCCGCQETTFNETCVVSDFPVEHFSGSRISFRVIADDSNVIAEAVYVVLGLPPSFPKNETIELQNPGIVQTTNSRKCGEIFIRLKYDPVDETVTLGIVECRGLKSDRKKNKLLDTYVKVQVIFGGETVQKFKTKLVPKNNNPRYDKTITLTGFFSRVKMTQTIVKLTVFTKSIPKYSIGYVMLGRGDDIMRSGYQHWDSIIDKPSLDIVQWHDLKLTRSMTP